MHAKLLIESIMRQTTVLIAQLASTAGIRAPLAHLADEIFLNLSRELEDQGVSRKVVADMFGMALRGYQRRVRRLSSPQMEGGRTLWQDVIQLLQDRERATKVELLNTFDRDDPSIVAAVLTDLVRTGFVSKTGSGASAVYAVTPEEARKLLDDAGKEESIHSLVWLDICRHPGASAEDVSGRVVCKQDDVDRAIERLRRKGRVEQRDDGTLVAVAFVLPVGAKEGWEVAVFDHFQAVAGALAAKLRHGVPQAETDDTTGGATLTFEVSSSHPLRSEVLGLLAEMRRRTDALWDKVEAENQQRPLADEEIERVVFYFGQFVKREDEDG